MSAATGVAVARAGGRRWLMWTLAASLALNGFLAGVLATQYLAGERRPAGPFHFETRMVARELPQDQQDAISAAVRARIPEFREDWRRLRALRGEINALAAETQPDRGAIDERLGEIRDITARMQARVQETVFDEVLALDPDLRARLAPDREDD